MTNAHDDERSCLASFDRHGWPWLILGGALLAASQVRFGLGVLAWIAPLPWLRYLRITKGLRSRVAFASTAFAAWSLALLKIITAPLPPVFAPLFALPIAVALSVPYLLAEPVRRRVGERVAVVTFGALMVCGEWSLHGVMPMGTWGAAGNTQLQQLALMQLASVAGLHGVSFLVYLFAATAESVLASPSRRGRLALAAVVALIALVAAGGQLRLALSTSRGTDLVRVAAVGTDSHVGQGPLPSPAEIESVRQALYERTRAAARAGAAMVVWTEAATMTEADDETTFLHEVEAVAREAAVTIVAGYVIPISRQPLRYYNRYAFVTPQGVHHVYDKHEPVPGEPAVRGTAPMPLYRSDSLGRVSGAICYDYDFPRLALRHASLDVDLVVLPSSDWRGIDPIHTQMASVRAIEGGHSLLRSTRFGLSAGFDPQGRARGWLSAFDAGDRVLETSLPRHGVTTIYGTLGDWFPLACAAFALLALLIATAPSYPLLRWRGPSSASRAEPSSRPVSDSASMGTSS